MTEGHKRGRVRFKFYPPVHPDKGTQPVGTLEDVEAKAILEDAGDGWYKYKGFAEILWDTQKTRRSGCGKVILIDEDGDCWKAEMEEQHD